MVCLRRHGGGISRRCRYCGHSSPLAPDAQARRSRAPLNTFLAVALDKWDGDYSYTSYLGIELLDLTPDAMGAVGQRQREQWLGLLLADLRTFELGARDRVHGWLPERRPDAALLKKRMVLLDAAVGSVSPHPPGTTAPDPAHGADQLRAAAPADQARRLSLCMQPVYVVHDEYMFIRVLQAFGVTFAAMAAEMRDAIAAARSGHAEVVAVQLAWCADTLARARSLFSLLATMPPKSFQIFRAYTVGASAIQSEAYKTFEAFCSPPSHERLESPAYKAVPRLRDRVREEWDDLSSAMQDSILQKRIDAHGIDLVRSAVHELERVHQRWKQTHWKMASRMIGSERGIGHTVGVPC